MWKNGLNIASEHFYKKNLLSKRPTIVDLGACEGGFSHSLALVRPEANYLLIEANENLITKLSEDATIKNKKIVNACVVSSHAGEKIDFNVGESIYGSYVEGVVVASKAIKKIRDVDTITIKKIFSLCSGNKIDLLKVDIEGSEWDFLDEFGIFEYSNINAITVEFHDFLNNNYKQRTLDCIRRLKMLGYRCVCEENPFWGPYCNCLFFK